MSGSQNRRSYVLGVANGALFNFGAVFIDPSTILALFISSLTGSDTLVGLLATAGALGRILPQIVVAGWTASVGRKIRIYHLSFVLRAIALVPLVLLVPWASSHPVVGAALVVGLYTLFSFGGGIAVIPLMEIISTLFRPSRRSIFFALRAFLGGAFGMGGGYLVRVVLSPSSGFDFRRTISCSSD